MFNKFSLLGCLLLCSCVSVKASTDVDLNHTFDFSGDPVPLAGPAIAYEDCYSFNFSSVIKEASDSPGAARSAGINLKPTITNVKDTMSFNGDPSLIESVSFYLENDDLTPPKVIMVVPATRVGVNTVEFKNPIDVSELKEFLSLKNNKGCLNVMVLPGPNMPNVFNNDFSFHIMGKVSVAP